MRPLEAVVVHLSAKGHTRWEGAVAQGDKRFEAWDFVNVADKEDIALAGALGTCQREQDLVEKCVAGVAFVRPGVVFGDVLEVGGVEDFMDDLVLEGFESRGVCFQV